MSARIKVAIAGVNGKMGRASVPMILEDPELELVGAFGRPGAGYIGNSMIAGFSGGGSTAVMVSNGIEDCFAANKPDVLLDFSIAEPAVEHAKYAIEHGVHPVLGVSGLAQADVEMLSALAKDKGVGAMIVPNFSIGAVLMIEFARQAGKHFGNVEIVEMHHTKKLDAPSGTSMYTTRKLAENQKTYNQKEVNEKELLPGARGAVTDTGVRVHSIRLPGLISHQDVIFGADGELLSIRHDSFNTNCFIKGIILSIKSVTKMSSMLVGLEQLL
ncbi:MAG: 4-hydroxy-tetrahydrodipicolinate reductase [Candidatus Melainabacteria bacterium]|nr:4-hydroxy-tetrahydrodipicolinate reductase [Candidatus Melainabacteria bacterium]